MAVPKKLLAHLNKNKIKYNLLKHKTVYTAYDLAQTLKEKLENIAKTLVIKTEGGYVLTVLPASRRLDLKKLKKCLGAKKVDICKELVMKKVFKIKPGTVTPFGKIHKNAPVYIDKTLKKAKKIIANAGDYEQSFHMKVKDFLKATEGRIADLAEKAEKKIKKKVKKK